MRTRIKNGLTVVGQGLRGLGRLVFTAPVRLLRLLFSLPMLLWRGLVGLLRFLARLPGRVWWGLGASIRFLFSLPRRSVRRVVGGWRRLILAFDRVHLMVREWRARATFWWRSRVFRPRTMSPRVQAVALVATTSASVILVLLSLQLLQPSRRQAEIMSVTATPIPVGTFLAPTTTASAASETLSPNATLSSQRFNAFGGGGAVVFSLRRTGNTDVYVRKLDDDQLLRLTYHPAQDREPVWAPDGETIVFVSQRGGNWDIYRLDLVSGVLIRLTRHLHYDAHPTWSPDGAFIAFESYRSGNLDLYIMAADGSQVQQLTANQAADFAPAWSPDGRHIAFVSYRDGSKDVFLYPLDAGTEAAVINLTQTPDRDEDSPTWSAEGSRLAFSVGRFGSEIIFITTFDGSNKLLDEAQTQLFNPGAKPDWSPDGTSLIYQYRRAGQTYLIADKVAGWEAGRQVFSSDVQIQNPDWSIPTVDPQTVVQKRQGARLESTSIFLEEILPTPEGGPSYSIVALRDVNGGDDREFMSDRVNDSFEALRQSVFEETGMDYLATIGDSFRAITVEPAPGQSPRSWHKAGRAFDLNQGLYEREERLLELVREDIGFRTYWRVYLRAARQDGSLGEPLHQAPWDLKARQAGGLAAREGGQVSQEVPLGYYVDFTELAADYGWERVPASNGWRQQWADTNWWQFQKTEGLTWPEAMLELYRLDQIEAVFGPLSEESQ